MFGVAASCNFFNELARNVVIFDDENTSSKHFENRKNNFRYY